MDARKYLEEVKKKEYVIKNKMDLLKEKYYNLSTPQAVNYESARVQRTQRTDLFESGICKCIEYDILFKRYIVGYDLNELSRLYDRSYSWVTTTIGRAIKSLQKLLDERKT